MSRFIKRFGTKGVPYQIDIVLNKLTMNVIVPDCQVSIVLKRGDHKSELKTAVILKDKVAKFEKQILSVPTKLYWDEKKQEFLTKMAEIQINIKHQKTVKCAGKIEFNAAEYATKEIFSQKEQRSLLKCPDPQAKLFYEIRVHELGDYSPYTTTKVEEEEEDEKSRQKQVTQTRGRDISPLPPSDNRSQIKDISEFNDRSVSPISRVDAKTVTFGPSQQQQQFQSSTRQPVTQNAPNSARGNNEDLQSKLFNNPQLQARQLSEDRNRDSSPQFRPGFVTQPIPIIKGSSDLANQSEMRNLFKQQKEENSSLRSKIQELIIEKEELKQQCDSFKNETQLLKSRISTLENQQISSITLPSELNSKKNQVDSQAYESKIQKLNEEIKTLKNQLYKDGTKANDLKKQDSDKQLKDVKDQSELKVADAMLKLERERSIWEKKNKDLELSLQEQQQLNSDQQSELSRKQKDIDYYKQLSNRSNRPESENEYALNLQKQLQELQSRYSQQEGEFKQKLKDLSEENSKLKKDKELELIDLRRSKTETDYELTKISRENDILKKESKDLTAKYQQQKVQLQQYSKEGNDPNSKSKEYQLKYEDLNNKVIKMSVERGNIEMERDNLKREIKLKEDEQLKQKYSINFIEKKLIQTKQMFSDVVNVIMMSGDRDLVDQVEPYLQQSDDQDSKQTSSFTTNLVYSQARSNEIYKSSSSYDKNNITSPINQQFNIL